MNLHEVPPPDDLSTVIRIVDDQPCPTCGASWQTPDCDSGPLDWPNRPKVTDADGRSWWRCYNPACDTAMYDPETGEVEKDGT
jgi:hypothetical protein